MDELEKLKNEVELIKQRNAKPFINAIVPTMGFMLSTLSIPFFKTLWLFRQNREE